MKKVAVIVGSLRKDSINRKLAFALEKIAPPVLKLSILDIAKIPLFNQDIELNMPKEVADFKHAIQQSDGVIWITPEYNRSIPGVLKNLIDWGTRPAGETVWSGKFMASLGASPGAIGTAVAQSHFRSIMVSLGAILMGQPEIYLVYKDDLIDEKNNITIKPIEELLQKFLKLFAEGLIKQKKKNDKTIQLIIELWFDCMEKKVHPGAELVSYS